MTAGNKQSRGFRYHLIVYGPHYLAVLAANARGPEVDTMDSRSLGLNRAARRKGSNAETGGTNPDDHLQELTGSIALWIYLAPNRRLKGYDALKAQVEALGCRIEPAEDAPVLVGKRYPTVKLTEVSGDLLPPEVLKQAHRWAHRNNFLHSFYIPDAFRPGS